MVSAQPPPDPLERVLDWAERAGLEVASVKRRGRRLDIVATRELESD